MAMIKCPECGQEVSSKSKKCINCRCRLKSNKTIILILVILIIIVVLGVLFCWVHNVKEKERAAKEDFENAQAAYYELVDIVDDEYSILVGMYDFWSYCAIGEKDKWYAYPTIVGIEEKFDITSEEMLDVMGTLEEYESAKPVSKEQFDILDDLENELESNSPYIYIGLQIKSGVMGEVASQMNEIEKNIYEIENIDEYAELIEFYSSAKSLYEFLASPSGSLVSTQQLINDYKKDFDDYENKLGVMFK